MRTSASRSTAPRRNAPRRSAAEALAAPAAGHSFPGASYPLELVSHLDEHLLWMRLKRRADKTLFARRRACVLLAEWLGHDPLNATYDELFAYQGHLLAVSEHKVANQTALLRPYFWWLQARGLRADNPAALLPLPRQRRGLPRPIAEPRLSEVIRTARPRLLPWFLLAAWSGLRAAEIAGLQVGDFHLDGFGQRWVRVECKGNIRDAPILGWIWPTIEAALPAAGPAWRRERGTGPVLARHVSELCCRHLRSLGFEDRVVLHDLRHRAATSMYETCGHDIRLVQEYLGHLSGDTTAIYTKVAPQRIAAAADLMPRVALPTDGRPLQVVDSTPNPALVVRAGARAGHAG